MRHHPPLRSQSKRPTGRDLPIRPLPWLLLVFTFLALATPPSTTAQETSESARYRVTFEASWSAAKHPQGFPPGPHFSGLIGGTHNGEVSFWNLGGPASPGIKNMAELGAKEPLRSEVEAAIATGTARDVVSGGGISLSPGETSLTFTVHRSHSRLTLVSMIAPSPDWFVGVSGLDLLRDGDWVLEEVVTLWPHDAGTDSGTIYTSPNQVTSPPVPISQITIAPFDGTPALGTFSLTRLDPPPPPDPDPVPRDTSLVLNGGRFLVDVQWRAPGASLEAAKPISLTEDTGYFWFSNEENVELVVKVLDACSINNRFWVFAGGLTSLEVDILVQDTASSAQSQYSNPQGTPFAPVLDTNAFATCP